MLPNHRRKSRRSCGGAATDRRSNESMSCGDESPHQEGEEERRGGGGGSHTERIQRLVLRRGASPEKGAGDRYLPRTLVDDVVEIWTRPVNKRVRNDLLLDPTILFLSQCTQFMLWTIYLIIFVFQCGRASLGWRSTSR